MSIKDNWKLLNEVKDLRNYFLIGWLVMFGLNLNTSIFFLYPLSLGLNFFEMMFVYFSLTRIVYLIALIPTGVLADKYSTKACIIMAILAFSLAYFARGFLPFIMFPLIAFIISEIIMGFSDASFSGASEKYEFSFTNRISDINIFSIGHSMGFFIRAISTLTGGLIVYFSSMRWTQIIGGIIIFIGFLLSFKIIKEPKYKKQERTSIETYKEGFKYAIRHKQTFFLIIGLSLLGLGIFASRNVFQPLLSQLGLNIENFAVAFGLIFSLQMVFSGIGSYLVQKIDKKTRMSLIILLTLLLMSLFLISLTFTNIIMLVVILIWLIAFTEGSQFTQTTILLNRFIKNEHIRATVNSISSLVSALVLAIFIPIIGKMTDNLGINTNLYISAGLIFLGAIILYIPHYNNKNSS